MVFYVWSATILRVFFWKFPTTQDPQHSGYVSKEMNHLRGMAHKYMCTDTVKKFNRIMRKISDVPGHVHVALRGFLFLGGKKCEISRA